MNTPTPLDPRRGEVWRVDLEPTRGVELRKTRPAVVIGSNEVGRLALRLVVPITEWNAGFASAVWMVRILPSAENGLVKHSAADTLQIRGADLGRFVERIGSLDADSLSRIAAAIANNVEYEAPSN